MPLSGRNEAVARSPSRWPRRHSYITPLPHASGSLYPECKLRGPSLLGRPPARAPGGLCAHACGCLPIIRSLTYLPARPPTGSGHVSQRDSGLSNPEGGAPRASTISTHAGRGARGCKGPQQSGAGPDFASSRPSVGRASGGSRAFCTVDSRKEPEAPGSGFAGQTSAVAPRPNGTN